MIEAVPPPTCIPLRGTSRDRRHRQCRYQSWKMMQIINVCKPGFLSVTQLELGPHPWILGYRLTPNLNPLLNDERHHWDTLHSRDRKNYWCCMCCKHCCKQCDAGFFAEIRAVFCFVEVALPDAPAWLCWWIVLGCSLLCCTFQAFMAEMKVTRKLFGDGRYDRIHIYICMDRIMSLPCCFFSDESGENLFAWTFLTHWSMTWGREPKHKRKTKCWTSCNKLVASCCGRVRVV